MRLGSKHETPQEPESASAPTRPPKDTTTAAAAAAAAADQQQHQQQDSTAATSGNPPAGGAAASVAGQQAAPTGSNADGSASGDAAAREKRAPFKCENGAIYTGEWSGNSRDGYGVQVWCP
mmetsp:Transcript_17063/g.14512  ORF Transcript_17063/g.14512 Transcript_17063/m.14512 type:complete len:121 (-) Transcript_17063:4-366(-)